MEIHEDCKKSFIAQNPDLSYKKNNYSFNSKDQCGKYVFNLMIVALAFSVLFISFCIAFFSKLGSFWLLSASIVSLTIAVSCFIPAYLKVKEGPIVGIYVWSQLMAITSRLRGRVFRGPRYTRFVVMRAAHMFPSLSYEFSISAPRKAAVTPSLI